MPGQMDEVKLPKLVFHGLVGITFLAGFIQKPYRPIELIEKIRLILSA